MTRITTANIKINSKAEAKKVASQLREVRSLRFMRVDADKQIWGTQEEGAWIKSNALLLLIDGKPKWYHLPIEIKNDKEAKEQVAPSNWTEDQEDGIYPTCNLSDYKGDKERFIEKHGEAMWQWNQLCKSALITATHHNISMSAHEAFMKVLGINL